VTAMAKAMSKMAMTIAPATTANAMCAVTVWAMNVTMRNAMDAMDDGRDGSDGSDGRDGRDGRALR